MALLRCPVPYSEEIIAFSKWQESQIDTENDKNPEIFYFSKILCFHSKSLMDFVDWNAETGQKGEKVSLRENVSN